MNKNILSFLYYNNLHTYIHTSMYISTIRIFVYPTLQYRQSWYGDTLCEYQN